MTKHLAVLGSPIAHSKSPLIHSAAYRVLKLDFDYSAIELAAGNLDTLVNSLDDSWVGLSVTAPLKEEAAKYARDDFERALGSCNTLVRTNDGWQAHNTDIFGLRMAFNDLDPKTIKRIAVIGAGATAKSALAAVAQTFPATKITLASRRAEPGRHLANFALHALKLEVNPTTDIVGAMGRNDLVISTLPAHALDEYAIKLKRAWLRKPHGVLFDVAYEPWPSKAAELWRNNSLTVINGIDMLLWQAIAQIRLFTSGSVETELFNEAAVLHAMKDSIGLL
ncbi:MAG: hypothetical protein RLZZ164_64 [Actinomycetota bacterium]|jgi:shikimate dehydrogenase